MRSSVPFPGRRSGHARRAHSLGRRGARRRRPPPFSATLRAHAAARPPSSDERRSSTLLRVSKILRLQVSHSRRQFHAFLRPLHRYLTPFTPLIPRCASSFDTPAIPLDHKAHLFTSACRPRRICSPLVASQPPSPHHALILDPDSCFIPSASLMSAWTRGPWLRS
ncbi:hypothetical protein OH76DRAFT_772135 [Lentinus brumalis]|uniref:Uncharacterized protein n=1 Tax=Lentinus brumalis TaxID=2498619 RepID=A0A371D4U0_9APHY|nr:hypothetical protein OH76DRAFT_772135 [Polyporus brumalis]